MSATIKRYFGLIRMRNLLIIGVGQLSFFFLVFQALMHEAGLSSILHPVDIFILSLCTICLAASGNVINDYFDVHIDAKNPLKSNSIPIHISESRALTIFWGFVTIGMLLAIYLSAKYFFARYFFIYPLSAIILVAYSRYLKCKPLVGNLIVSFFTAFVMGIITVPDWINYGLHLPEMKSINALTIAFISFGFLSNLCREAIKDLEDYQADISASCKTLAAYNQGFYGKLLSFTTLLILLFGILYWMLSNSISPGYIQVIYVSIFLLLYGIFILFKIVQSKINQDYHSVSQHLKLFMIFGLIYALMHNPKFVLFFL